MKTLFRLSLLVLSLAIFWTIQGCGGSGDENVGGGGTPLIDMDNDGLVDVADPDDDADGILDVSDAFPQDASESSDLDGDGIGDNADDDVDGDGSPKTEDCNDFNASINPNAIDHPDGEYVDTNCDGVDGDASAAVWVSPTGNDANVGTFELPVLTLGQGIILAAAKPVDERDVYILHGNYAEDVTLTDDVNLYGGFGLDAGGALERDLDLYQPVIQGQDGVKSVTVVFPSSSMVFQYSLLLQNTHSQVQGIRVEGDVAGSNTFIIDSDATVDFSRFDDDVPTVSRDFGLTIVVVITSADANPKTVTLQNNEINMMGTDNTTDGYSSGVVALPAKDADGSLTLTVDDNTIYASGDSDRVFGVNVADNDENPADADAGDGRGEIALTARNNTITLGTTAGVSAGISGGNLMGEPLGDASLYYLARAEMSGNRIFLNAGGSEVGLNFGGVRETALASNNIISGRTNISSTMIGVLSLVSPTELLYNTIFMTSSQPSTVVGFYSANMEPALHPEFANFAGTPPGRVINNIFSLSSYNGAGCGVMGALETMHTNDDALAHLAGPTTLANNDFFIAGDCSVLAVYGDQPTAITDQMIVTVADLNAKTRFAPTDTSSISGNLAVDPKFVNTATYDFSLTASSSCIDAGLEFETGWFDINGTARPQGAGVDVGAFER